MNVCNKCVGVSGWIILVLGILFLLGELLTFYGRWRAGGLRWWGARK